MLDRQFGIGAGDRAFQQAPDVLNPVGVEPLSSGGIDRRDIDRREKLKHLIAIDHGEVYTVGYLYGGYFDEFSLFFSGV